MKKVKPILLKLKHKVAELQKPVTSQREMWLEEFVAAFSVVVWIGAMTLLP